MSKKAVISLSIIVFLIALIGILFGAVFCLRSQTVTVVGETPIEISKEEIITTAGLENGKSIFMLNKEEAINKIEATYPYVKVIQIKTTSLTKIDIIIRSRHDMCYAKNGNNYYVMDEELKILKIIPAISEGEESNEPTELIHIHGENINLNSSTMVCDFVGSSEQKQTMYDLYNAMINVVTKTEGEKGDNKEVYFSRKDVCETLKEIEFKEYETFSKIIITTKHGVKLDIENPNEDLQNKINICFSTIKSLIEEGKDREKSGTIKIYYDLQNNQKFVYIEEGELSEDPQVTE